MAKKTMVPVVEFEDYDEFEKHGPKGAILFASKHDSDAIASVVVKCPGCGEISALPIRPCREKESWDMKQRSPLTLHPSVHHSGGCGWHGWIKNGQWVL